ncbi:BRCT domain-containing protein [Thioalkalivibrio sp. HK1]|uniref:BRCT domain-containing protein n=1 Tax=Thioalkalivibrio sp. HK1 TaxID=1469245 RepID=UPI00046FCE68|nr:BRCT domain-containing protein [Thioalkalivibrio sp. HK1]
MNTDLYVRYNRKNIQDRQIDTLIGLSRAFIADRVVNQAEAECLHAWLVQSSDSKNPIVLNLLSKVAPMMEDGELDAEEAAELFKLLQNFSGGEAEPDEAFKTTRLPVCSPAPEIHFQGGRFLFTGTCAFGTRKRCQEEVERRGGINLASVTRNLDYLILGDYVTASWAHETFGRKIEKAMQYRDAGVPLSIITEEHWLTEAGL